MLNTLARQPALTGLCLAALTTLVSAAWTGQANSSPPPPQYIPPESCWIQTLNSKNVTWYLKELLCACTSGEVNPGCQFLDDNRVSKADCRCVGNTEAIDNEQLGQKLKEEAETTDQAVFDCKCDPHEIGDPNFNKTIISEHSNLECWCPAKALAEKAKLEDLGAKESDQGLSETGQVVTPPTGPGSSTSSSNAPVEPGAPVVPPETEQGESQDLAPSTPSSAGQGRPEAASSQQGEIQGPAPSAPSNTSQGQPEATAPEQVEDQVPTPITPSDENRVCATDDIPTSDDNKCFCTKNDNRTALPCPPDSAGKRSVALFEPDCQCGAGLCKGSDRVLTGCICRGKPGDGVKDSCICDAFEG